MKSLSIFNQWLMMGLLLTASHTSFSADDAEKFVDDTEVYDYINDEDEKETKPKQSLTFVIDNSGSMGTYTEATLPKKEWNPDTLYQSGLEKDDCDFCDHASYSEHNMGLSSQRDENTRKIQGFHVKSKLFSDCQSNGGCIEQGENIQILTSIAWPLVYPSLIFDGKIELGSARYDGICKVVINKVSDGYPYKYEFIKDSNILSKEVIIPVKDHQECEGISKKRILEHYLIQKAYNTDTGFDKNKKLIGESFKIQSREYEDKFNCDAFANELEQYKKTSEKFKKLLTHYAWSELNDSDKNTLKANFLLKGDRDYEFGRLYGKYALYRIMDFRMHPYVNIGYKKDKDGRLILNDSDKRIPIYFNVLDKKKYEGTPRDLNSYESTSNQYCALKQITNKHFISLSTFNYRNYLLSKSKSKDGAAAALSTRYDLVMAALDYTLRHYIPENTKMRFVTFASYVKKSDLPDTVKFRYLSSKGRNHEGKSIYEVKTHDRETFNLGIDQLMSDCIGKLNADGVKVHDEKECYDVDNPTALQDSLHKVYEVINPEDREVVADQVMAYLKAQSYGGSTPTTDALWAGFQLAQRTLEPKSSCITTNQIMLFTDGDASGISPLVKTKITELFDKEKEDDSVKELIENCSNSKYSAENSCNELLAQHMGNTEHSRIGAYPDSSENRVIKDSLPIFAVGFKGGMSVQGEKALHALSNRNRGSDAKMVSNFSELKEAFKEAAKPGELQQEMTVSPAAPPSAGGGVSKGETAFFGMFKPLNRTLWNGNIKCYKVAKTGKDDNKKLVYLDQNSKRLYCAQDVGGSDTDSCKKGHLDPTTVDYFNPDKNVADGSDVLKGGIVQRMAEDTADPSDRNIKRAFFDSAINDQAMIRPDSSKRRELEAALQVSWEQVHSEINKTAPELTDALKELAITWLSGYRGTPGNLVPRKQLGDFIHSEIAVLNYETGNKSVLFAGSNDGYFRAFQVRKTENLNSAKNWEDFGKQIYSFIPQELFNIVWWKLAESNVKPAHFRSKHYGFDGSITPLHIDTNLDGIVNTDEKAYIIVGMRRGGNSYYLFDVSNPFDTSTTEQTNSESTGAATAKKGEGNIQFIRRIAGVETFLNRPITKKSTDRPRNLPKDLENPELDKIIGGKREKKAYRVLAQTWSKPSLVKLPLSKRWKAKKGDQEIQPPAGCDRNFCYAWIFGGGYNPSARDQRRTAEDYKKENPDSGSYESVYTESRTDVIGNAVYMINAATGELLWWGSSDKAAKTAERGSFIEELESVPGGVTTINAGGDNGNATDAGFFFDIEGGLYRINFHDFMAKIDTSNEVNPLWSGLKRPKYKHTVVSLGKITSTSKKAFTYYRPAVTFLNDVNGDNFFAIGFGTGYRSNPKNITQNDNIMGVVFDYPVYDPKTNNAKILFAENGASCPGKGNCLVNVTAKLGDDDEKLKALKKFNVQAGDNNKVQGWYVNLPGTRGAKVITEPLIVNGNLVIESFTLPPLKNDKKLCVANLGERTVWGLNLRTSLGALEGGVRFKLSGTSLPAERLGVIKYKGEYFVTGTKISGDDNDAVKFGKSDQPKLEVGWREAIENGSFYSVDKLQPLGAQNAN